ALADFISAGWPGKIDVDESALMMAFATPTSAVAGSEGAGCVRWDSDFYYSDSLVNYTGQRLEMRVPEWDPRQVYVLLPTKEVVAVPLDKRFNLARNDEGPHEAKRRKKHTIQVVTDSKEHCDRLDLVSLEREWSQEQDQAPNIPIAGRVSLGGETEQMAALEAAAEKGRKLLGESSEDTGDQAVSQFVSSDVIAEHTNVEWENEE
ncbi:MAG: hypothetical protein GY862_11655, partial [Gammaproteobacteria bacterium]|nr:hypothetical protein [Gammaproteobacteria bacterium]